MRRFTVLLALAYLVLSQSTIACTGVAIVGDDHVVVGGNEDWQRWDSHIWAKSATNEAFGAVFFGYQIRGEFGPRGRYWFEFQGINDQGLFFDTFGAPTMPDPTWSSRPPAPDHIEILMMEQCSTVAEAIELLGRYDLTDCSGYDETIFRSNMQFFLADRTGAVAAVSGGEVIHMEDSTFVVTNFRLNRPSLGGWPCWRYNLAHEMLESDATVSIDRVAEILSAVQFPCSQGIASCTRYAVVSDLTTGEIRLYYGGDFDRYASLTIRELTQDGLERAAIADLFDAPVVE